MAQVKEKMLNCNDTVTPLKVCFIAWTRRKLVKVVEYTWRSRSRRLARFDCWSYCRRNRIDGVERSRLWLLAGPFSASTAATFTTVFLHRIRTGNALERGRIANVRLFSFRRLIGLLQRSIIYKHTITFTPFFYSIISPLSYLSIIIIKFN